MSKINKCIPIVVFLLFITVGISRAEPTPTISYLMNTPVSMLDFGILKLNTRLESFGNKLMIGKTEPLITVFYEWNSNRIKIFYSYLIKKGLYKGQDIKQEITHLIEMIKESYFGYDHKTGKQTEFGRQGGSQLLNCFAHYDYVLKNEPKNLVKELEKITEIYISVVVLGDSTTKGTSPLISNKIYWSK